MGGGKARRWSGAKLWLGAVLWLLVFVLGGALLWARAEPADRAPPSLVRIPDFELLDQEGAPFRSAERLDGKLWIAAFGFTHCTSVCPMLTAQLGNVTRRLAEHGDRVHSVMITIEPEVDTPEVLRAYAERYDADFSRWSFLTGEPEHVRTVVTRGFMVPVGQREARPQGYDILHTGQLMLIDPRMHLRGLYATDQEGLDALVRDVQRVLSESE